MNLFPSDSLSNWDIPQFLVDAKSSTSWDVQKGVDSFNQLLEDQKKQLIARKSTRATASTLASLEDAVSKNVQHLFTLSKLTTHLFRALSTVLSSLGALPSSIGDSPNPGSFGGLQDLRSLNMSALSTALQELQAVLPTRATVDALSAVDARVDNLQQEVGKSNVAVEGLQADVGGLGVTLEGLKRDVATETTIREGSEAQLSERFRELNNDLKSVQRAADSVEGSLADVVSKVASLQRRAPVAVSGAVDVVAAGGSIADAIRHKRDTLQWKDVVKFDGSNYLEHVRSLDTYMASNAVKSYDDLDVLVYGTKCTAAQGKKMYEEGCDVLLPHERQVRIQPLNGLASVASSY